MALNHHDIEAELDMVFSDDVATVTAGGGGDGLEVDGEAVDRLGYNSAMFGIQSQHTLAASETLTLEATVQEADATGGPWTDVSSDAVRGTAAEVVATGAVTDGTQVKKVAVNCAGLKRYIRLQMTPTFSAGATDTAKISTTAVLGGAISNPPRPTT